MTTRRLVCLTVAALLAMTATASAYDWQNRDAGSKIRGDYRNGPLSSPAVVRTMQAPRSVVVSPAPQVVRNNAPAQAPQAVRNNAPAPQPNTMAQANDAPSRSTRTFSAAPQATMSPAPAARNFYNAPSRGLNLRADRKILGYHGYGL